MKNPLQLETDAGRRAGLLEEGIGPELKDAIRRPWVSVGAQHEDGRACAGIVAANHFNEFETVYAG
jgi:hypothetical protein